MKNQMEDIVANKNKSNKKTPPKDDMLSKLAEERNKRSIPNNFQQRSNTISEESESISMSHNEENHNEEDDYMGDNDVHEEDFSSRIKVVDTTSDLSGGMGGFRKRKRGKKVWRYGFFALVFLALVFFALNLFASVKIFITPKTEQFVFENEKFQAKQDTENGLPFTVMSVEATEEKEFTFSDTKELSTKATGTVVLYNEYSSTAQKLLINTRLSDDDGLVYMTDKAVTIPGLKKEGGKTIPGSVTVTVTAQNAGSKYNSQKKDFKIVGFKGSSKYDTMYARAKTDFSGGAEGKFYTPSDTEKGKIKSDFDIKLRDALTKKLEAEVPEGYIFYADSMNFSTSLDEESFLANESNHKIEATGTATAVIFKREDLLHQVVKRAYPTAGEMDIKEIDIPELNNFKFAFSDSSYKVSKEKEDISFTLSGNGTLEWSPLVPDLQKKLIGVSKNEMDSIFIQDPGILHARVVFRPPWARSMPENIEKIKILEETKTNNTKVSSVEEEQN